MPAVYVVTDPMCSWCYGMAAAVEETAHRLAEEVRFDLLLGGINVHASQPIGEFGRRHLMKLWAEVQETTGQTFGFKLPEPFVYNSTLPCVALEAFRARTGAAPFGYLHRLQQCLFEEGRNIATADVLDWVAQEFGWARGELAAALEDQTYIHRAAVQFENSRLYGTNALPNVLIERQEERRLLFGGYADSEMMEALIRQALAAAPSPGSPGAP
ncbi:MAG: DsbA family protein [Pseudomonadota bacterium]